MIRKIFYLFIIFLLLFNSVYAAGHVIKGKVRDKNTYQELSFVNIWVKDTQFGALSNISGEFTLNIPKPAPQMIIVFQHIAYDRLELPLEKIESGQTIDLQPRVIPLPQVEIEAQGEQLEIDKDLPQTITLYKANMFKLRGFIDAGDLLKTDHSVKIEEQISGKKTIAIRGGNADEVVVMYNGIKLNNTYNNISDLSLIDLEDIERFEIIKGSNTVLYGSEALSGVINIVPRTQQDYNIRLYQRVGTYNSGNWGVHLYQHYNRFHLSYSMKHGGSRRQYSQMPGSSGHQYLQNKSTHHTASIVYDFSPGIDVLQKNSLQMVYMNTSLDYENDRYNETSSTTNQLLTLQLNTDYSWFQEMNFNIGYRWQNEDQYLSQNDFLTDRDIEDRAFFAKFDKQIKFNLIDFLFTYQFENTQLDYQNVQINPQFQDNGLNPINMNRKHHGIALITKLNAPSGSEYVNEFDFDLSIRHDNINDKLSYRNLDNNSENPLSDRKWHDTIVKFSTDVGGYRHNFDFKAFFNIGINAKFPTLFQQISSPFISDVSFSTLEPETNKSIELGLKLTRDTRDNPNIYGWQISGNYFKNDYENKIRMSYTPDSPLSFYDNVPIAQISGIESASSIFLFKKKVTIEFGLSRYFISEKAAFPFKYEFKRILNFHLDHTGYSFQVHWFKEGEQIAWIRRPDGEFAEFILPDYMNIDLHLKKSFTINKFKLFANVSIRNLLDDDIILEGLALRDRRFYISFGAQY